MTMRARILFLSSLSIVVGVLAALAPRAHAQAQDFGSCSPDLTACDSTTFNCCYRPFDPVATDFRCQGD